MLIILAVCPGEEHITNFQHFGLGKFDVNANLLTLILAGSMVM